MESFYDAVYDAENNPVKLINYADKSRAVVKDTYLQKFENGLLIERGFDYNNDGDADLIINYKYVNSNPNEYYQTYDFNHDGTPEVVYYHTQDLENGVTIVKDGAFKGADIEDTTFTNVRTSYFNELGQSEKVVYTNDKGENLKTVIQQFDEKGHVVTAQVDLKSDGNINTKYAYVYDEKTDRRVMTKNDINGDDVFDRYTVFDYDERGFITEIQYKDAQMNTTSSVNYEYNELGRISHSITNNGEKMAYNYYGYNQLDDGGYDIRSSIYGGSKEHDYTDNLTITKEGSYELGKNQTSHFNMTGLENITVNSDNVQITISDDVLDKIANDDNNHKVIVNSSKSGDKLHLDGNFTKTAETESHSGQDYVKYTDEAGNALIVDPDITVDII
ncbi:hypothetical protein [Pasteurella atlantica]|uniref:hypothetical protein n=1 Tax=Pasteurellaceae TaxID=712 RepID=UPI002758E89E|nr:hypothetical protein [Pasteurella atlantica]MDP8100117.1 hypothetical protein [Pasteurella atlantica]MDP8107999.1 hypothetical protein [Pasteurella atlantica]MDP8117708.1 hypothetical protein [Pasteurella atlantica]